MTVMVLATTSALVVGVIEFSRSSGRTANVAKGRVGALALAEAGIADALAVLNYWNDATMTNNASDPTLLGCNAAGTVCTPVVTTSSEGSTSWNGVLDATTSTWTITSVGQVANPTGGPVLRRTLTAKVGVTWNNSQPSNATAWNYVYSTAPPAGGCEFDFEPNNNGGTIIMDVPLYVTGDLCFNTNNAIIDERGEGQTPAPQPIDIRVGGRIAYIKGGAVGVVSDKITSAAVVGGCSTSISGAAHTCAPPGDAYYVDTNTTFQSITAPTADFGNGATSYYATASPGPKHACVTATSPANLAATTFESVGSTTANASAAAFNLTGTSYQCKTYLNDATSGVQVGELSWNSSTHVLTIRGVVFIDANVTVTDAQATYQGTGSIYVGGTLTFTSGKLCSNSTCDFTTWNPNTEMIMFVVRPVGDAIVFQGGNAFQGGLFCNPTSRVNFSGNNSTMEGPVVCGNMAFSNNTTLKPLPAITELPLGAPGNPNVHAVPGSPVYGG
jgi:hypothetical protein